MCSQTQRHPQPPTLEVMAKMIGVRRIQTNSVSLARYETPLTTLIVPVTCMYYNVFVAQGGDDGYAGVRGACYETPRRRA